MISSIQGKIKSRKSGKVLVEVAGGICYEVLVPEAAMRGLEKNVADGQEINFVTYHYFQTDPSKSIPVLIGFLSDIEKEFFEKFITVSGVGPKAACRALALPISEIADAIDAADLTFLKKLPGIGEQRAKEIIAKLQGKVGKFGLIQDRFAKGEPKAEEGVKEEALSVLLQLQYRRKEAQEMIEKALRRSPDIASGEELLNEVYKARQNEKK
ncbi:MAG: helix-hairpin-helix domain-containing protein [Omnitrophica bacterium]|nr:helix-hairpin-helix domain-containing protein [Candidatus Omnitrophota bacterium]